MKIYKSRKGMTLVELSIVTAILATILVGIFSSYYYALKVTKDSDPRGGTTRRDIFFALENLRTTFAQTYYIQGHKRLLFVGKNEVTPQGRSDKVVFAANHPNSEETNTPSVREVSYFLKLMCSDCEYYYLIKREDEMVDTDPLNGGMEHILLSHVKSFQLKYSQRGDKWQDDWNTDDTKKIPKLIRIEIIALIGDSEVKYETLSYPGFFFK
jgi:general secretion pathway protein J